VGYGDDIMASGMARGAAARGERIAFGDGKRIIWGPWSADIFRNNPNVARPGSERDRDIRWIEYYKGHRLYNTYSVGRWIWNMGFRPMPGEIFFDDNERQFSYLVGEGSILIEPNVPWQKSCAVNKDWGEKRYQEVADALLSEGHKVVQFVHKETKRTLSGARLIRTATFRNALALMSRARLAIVPEGGLHHGAAALGIPAVVIFGGFVPPIVTGYDMHVNLKGNTDMACGSLSPCKHCRSALDAITVDEVLGAAEVFL